MTSLVEEFKRAESSLEMTLSQSKDPAVKNTASKVKTGKKWNPKEVVQHAQGTLQHRDIIGQVQSGRARFELGDSWKSWGRRGGRGSPALFSSKKRELDEQQLLRQSKGNG